jgi:hypothetical protein
MNVFTGKPHTDAPIRMSSPGLSASSRRPGNHTGNAGGNCTADEAAKHRTVTRNQVREAALVKATAHIRQVAGREPRRARRAMARSLAKRMLATVWREGQVKQ